MASIALAAFALDRLFVVEVQRLAVFADHAIFALTTATTTATAATATALAAGLLLLAIGRAVLCRCAFGLGLLVGVGIGCLGFFCRCGGRWALVTWLVAAASVVAALVVATTTVTAAVGVLGSIVLRGVVLAALVAGSVLLRLVVALLLALVIATIVLAATVLGVAVLGSIVVATTTTLAAIVVRGRLVLAALAAATPLLATVTAATLTATRGVAFLVATATATTRTLAAAVVGLPGRLAAGFFGAGFAAAAEQAGPEPLEETGLGHRQGDDFLFSGDRARIDRLDSRHRRLRRDVEVVLAQRNGVDLLLRLALVARLAGFLDEVGFLQALHRVVRRLDAVVGHHHHRRVMATLDVDQRAALLVVQVVGDVGRGLHQHLRGVVLHRLFLGEAQDRQGQ